MAGRTLTAGAADVAGRIGGAVLAAIRHELGATQEAFAERVRVGLSTVQAWESGRRPLVNASFQDIQRLSRQLRLAGAPPSLLHVLEQGLLADSIYADMAAGTNGQHPLAAVVPDRMLTELLAWPLTGAPPRQLRATKAQLHVAAGARDDVAAGLRRAADTSAGDERGAMVRRQVKFLVAENPASVEWVRQQAAADVRQQPDVRSWSPAWAATRSQAVTAAHAGDLDALRRFIGQGLDDEAAIAANLNYWAYWVGEHHVLWTRDADMIQPSQDWSGDRLLDSLVEGIVHAPYRELCAHALWALLRSRRHLMARPAAAQRIAQAVDLALNAVELDDAARRRLEQVWYLTESAG
ncbi:helix-turn-helix domain-containing protein [Nocardioides sp.]|uniref:helix-turn-helix domain-containing protein n=1 Tax=Nocardioides sp. TaxID=35761 RepID=UPI003D0E55EC